MFILNYNYLCMKKVVLLLMVMFAVVTLSAQQGQRATPEERAKRQTEALVEKLGLTKEQKEKVYDIYLKSAQSMPQRGENVDREKMREQFQKTQKERDEAIKALLTEEQQKKYDELQKEMQEQMKNRRR
jgi:biopolymer transport protein ExbD